MAGPITGKEQQVALDQLWETLKTKGQERINQIRAGASSGADIIDCELPDGNIVKLTKDECGKKGGKEALKSDYIDRIIAQLKKTAKSIDANPRISRARNTSYMQIEYGILRKAAKARKNEISIPYSSSWNPFALNKKAFTSSGIEYAVDANMYIGVTKASIMEAISDEIEAPDSDGQQTAAFSMAIKKLTYTGSTLTIQFHNMPGKSTAIPNADYSAYIPLSLSESKYDHKQIWIGRYVNPGEVSADSFMQNFLEAWNFEVMNNLRADYANGTAKFLQVSKDEVISTQFICCILFEFLKGFPDIGEFIKTNNLDPNNMSALYIWTLNREKEVLEWRLKQQEDKLQSLSDGNDAAQIATVQSKINELNDKIIKIDEDIEYYKNNSISLQEILDEQKDWLTTVREILVITLSLSTSSAFNFAWPSLKFNMIEWLLSMIYIILLTMLDEIQKWSMQEALGWVQQKKKEAQDIYEEEANDNGFCTDPTRPQSGATAEFGGEFKGGNSAYDAYLLIKNEYSSGECIGGSSQSKEGCLSSGGSWVSPKERCEDAGYHWNQGSSLQAAAISCLPWEQLLIVVVQTIFGNEGLFKHLKGFVDRMKRHSMLKLTENSIEAEDEKSWLDNLIPVLEGAIGIIDALLTLNISAIQTCVNMSPGQYFESPSETADDLVQCTLTDENGEAYTEQMTRQACEDAGGIVVELVACEINGVISQMTAQECEDAGGSEVVTVPESSSTIILGGPSSSDGATGEGTGSNMQSNPGSSTGYSTTGKLDITGTSVDPLAMLVFQDDGAISTFLMQHMGLSSQEAADAVAGAKKGECLKSLTAKEVEQLETILNQVGLEL